MTGEDGDWWKGDPQALPIVDPGSAGSDLLAIPGFLTPGQCAMLIEAFGASTNNLGKNADGEAFWDERVLWFDQVSSGAAHAKAVMQQARFVAAYRIAEHFAVEKLLYSDSQQLVLWKEGRGMPVHVDNAHPDGSHHNTPHRAFASVVYLNDDYEGGEIFFPRLGCRIKPTAGLLVAFRGTADAPHGVTTVRRGERYTMPSWYSTDSKVAEGSMFRIL
jgi:predicted 2-oxoglutarate/Fe(II)-dependent dioxygenase YbiX